MKTVFKRIALVGRYGTPEAHDTLEKLIHFLQKKSVKLLIEAETAKFLTQHTLETVEREALAQSCDLVIVIGGDGSLLNAARAVVEAEIPVIGINRGMLGFLTDLSPDNFEDCLNAILQGDYQEERRFLLCAEIYADKGICRVGDALNDVVLYAGEVARMIEFELYVDGQFVYSQRSDGLIIATPTGSTAYALSGGGPILQPSLEAIVLVPMFPHTLTSRPIVVNSHSIIELRIAKTYSEIHPAISCDGQQLVALSPGAKLRIHRKEKTLKLIHPKEYNYYNTLRTKLEWGSKLGHAHIYSN